MVVVASEAAFASSSGTARPVLSAVHAAAPSAPVAPSAAPGNRSAVVRWQAPASAGGSHILDYVVTMYIGGSLQAKKATVKVPNVSASISGLPNGQNFCFKVAAENANGQGPKSRFTNCVNVGSPGAPTRESAVRVTKGSLRVTFVASPSNGAPIDSYVAYCYPTSGGQWRATRGKAGPLLVTKLSAGRKYQCETEAQNKWGLGVPSTLSAVVIA
jgi:titin